MTTHFALRVALRVASKNPIAPLRSHNWSEATRDVAEGILILWANGCQLATFVPMLLFAIVIRDESGSSLFEGGNSLWLNSPTLLFQSSGPGIS